MVSGSIASAAADTGHNLVGFSFSRLLKNYFWPLRKGKFPMAGGKSENNRMLKKPVSWGLFEEYTRLRPKGSGRRGPVAALLLLDDERASSAEQRLASDSTTPRTQPRVLLEETPSPSE